MPKFKLIKIKNYFLYIISDRSRIQRKDYQREIRGHCVIIRANIPEKNITTPNIYASKTTTNRKKKLIELKGKVHKSHFSPDLNTRLTAICGATRQYPRRQNNTNN